MELQALADIGKRHVVPLAMLIILVVGIDQSQPKAVVPALDAHFDHAGRDSRLDSVVDGVFHQGLQEHRRHESLLDRRIQLPIDPEPLPQAQLLQVEILATQRDLVPESDQLAVVDHDGAEQLRQILQSALGSLRILANQRKHGIQRIEKEMRTDASLKRLQPCLGNRRRKCPVAKVKIPRDRSCPQRRVAKAPGEFAPLTASAEQGLEREERGGYRKHDRKDRQQAGNVREPLEQRGPRVKHDHPHWPYWFQPPCDLGDFCGELADLPRARQSEKQGERVDGKQDARNHTQIAEGRQGVGQVALPYTLHFCADAKVDACGDEPRASRLRCILQATMAAKPKPGKELWSGRFAEPVSELVRRYTASVRFDRRLAPHDIRASLAHARMLRAVRILTAADLKAIELGLSRISREVETGRFRWSLAAEDVHVNIERRLIALVGEAGKRLHTARSRNDQVATDLRLWLREAIDEIGGLLRNVEPATLD